MYIFINEPYNVHRNHYKLTNNVNIESFDPVPKCMIAFYTIKEHKKQI